MTKGQTFYQQQLGCSSPLCPAPTHTAPLAPTLSSTDVSVGLELGLGAAVYLTSGIALTGELTGDIYFGDSMRVYPVVGLGLGLMVDYELLP